MFLVAQLAAAIKRWYKGVKWLEMGYETLRYSPHHPFGCGWHHLQHSHSEAFQETGSWFQRVKKLASELHVHSVNFAAKLVHTRLALFQYCYQLSSGAGFKPSLQPSWSPLIFPFLLRWRIFTVLGTKVAPFPYLMLGVAFTACVVFSFFFLFWSSVWFPGFLWVAYVEAHLQYHQVLGICCCSGF